jgi:hypothetical protein
MLNVGTNPHPFHPHGNHTVLIAQDGRLLLTADGTKIATTEHFGETIGTGQTQDYTMRWDSQDSFSPSSPYPIAQPNYQNLKFKDSNTWYAGTPYLGYKGTLPIGTVSQNLCGEWYFPFHSHALNEFANYDEGFGGMGTLLRVDPQGGCFTAPTATTILAGALNTNGGTFANLKADDSSYYVVKSTTVAPRRTDWYAQFSGIVAGSSGLSVTYNGHNSAANPPVATSLYYWKWTSPAGWQLLPGATGGTADFNITASIPTNGLGTGANKGLVRVRVLSQTGAANFTTSADFMKLTYTAP